MYKCKDFWGNKNEVGGMFSPDIYESIEELMEQVNHWIEKEKIDVLNIETLLTPISLEQTSGDKDFEEFVRLFQVVRVWYRT